MNGIRKHAWFRQPLMALVIGLPALAVAAGVATLVVASGGPDARGADVVLRTAQMQVTDLSADAAAARAGRRARASIDPSGDRLSVRFEAGVPAGDELRLELVHPTNAALDRSATLARLGDTWTAPLAAPLESSAWDVVVLPVDRRWRIAGRLARGGTQALLGPRIEAGP